MEVFAKICVVCIGSADIDTIFDLNRVTSFIHFMRKVYKYTWQYVSELTGGKGVTFATGTPISNSMTELYTNMRYLQYGTLQKLGLGHFDSWASSFGETQTAIDIACQL